MGHGSLTKISGCSHVRWGNVTTGFPITELTTDGWVLCKSRKQENVSGDGIAFLKYLSVLKGSVNQKLLNNCQYY